MTATYHLVTSSNVIAVNYDPDWAMKASVMPLIEDIGHARESLSAGKWAFYDDIRNWPIKSPAQIDACTQATHAMIDSGLTHCVVCGKDIGVSHWVMEKIFAEKVKLAFFTSPEECLGWLKSNGFNTQLN
ncbi:hypothetical protein [Alteromonas halophila]|uniref:Uncharacterized protein n=1 Tax=Alteromonas halophila TaxID=516698 RepID=A0A918JEP1_9ALTE|nr:hypothetical protein [Alteromonas halophila]GGW75304.1 hypothetical protein GCM10007391_04450 [Alteromonas halophila]